MFSVNWIDRITHEEVLKGIKEERELKHSIQFRSDDKASTTTR